MAQVPRQVGACRLEGRALAARVRRPEIVNGAARQVGDYSLRVVDSETPRVIRVRGSEYRVLVQAGPVTIEVNKDGYHPKSASLEVRSFVHQDIEIEPVNPPAVFNGGYWMTLSADPASCGLLPRELRERRYAVDVAQQGVSLTLHMSDPTLTGQKVQGQIRGNALSFYLWSPDAYYGIGVYSLEERLDDTRRLVVVGSAQASVADGGANGQVNGTWEVLGSPEVQRCEGVHALRIDPR